MTKITSLTVNGKPQEVAEDCTVARLLDTLRIRPERVVVEVNLKILKRHEHAATALKAGDQVEIVRFVGGGALDDAPLRTVGFRLRYDLRRSA